MEDENYAYKPIKFPRSWEDIESHTLFASKHYFVVDVLVEKGMEIKEGHPLLVLDIIWQRPKSTRSTQSDSQDIVHSLESLQLKDNDNGQYKRVTLTAVSACLVAEVMVVKGMRVKPREPLYALKYADMQDYSKEAVEQSLLSNRKWLDELRQIRCAAMAD